MIAGELYFSPDPELVADRKFAREQMHLINRESGTDDQRTTAKRDIWSVAGRIYIEPNVRFDYGYNISVGKISMPIMIVSFRCLSHYLW